MFFRPLKLDFQLANLQAELGGKFLAFFFGLLSAVREKDHSLGAMADQLERFGSHGPPHRNRTAGPSQETARPTTTIMADEAHSAGAARPTIEQVLLGERGSRQKSWI